MRGSIWTFAILALLLAGCSGTVDVSQADGHDGGADGLLEDGSVDGGVDAGDSAGDPDPSDAGGEDGTDAGADDGGGQDCSTDPQLCPVCAEGAITERCRCGLTAHENGYCCAGVFTAAPCDPNPQVLAFPGVEGFGAQVSGGRGGQVIKVTTLDATGPGSLDEALRTPGPRIVVFEVSGLINADLDITEPDLTIAGQTAPGAGITIVGRLMAPFAESDGSSRVNNIIIRHLRVRHICRPGMADNQCDTMRLSSQSRFVLDHVSLSWGVDETLDLWGGSHEWTIQDSTFEHPCRDSNDSPNHAYGILNRRGGRGSLLRVAMLNCRDRNPAFADGPFDIINMLVYNHQTGLTHHNPATGAFNVIGNIYRWGPGGGIGKPFWVGGSETGPTEPLFWFQDNVLDDTEVDPFGAFDDPWLANHELLGEDGMGGLATTHRAAARHDYSGYPEWVAPTVLPSAVVFDNVLTRAGAFPRDVVTRDAVREARDRTGSIGCPVRQQLDGQGNAPDPHPLMAGLSPSTPPLDSDDDGMPDAWETAQGLNPADGGDHGTMMPSGYSAIETYINELADQLVPQ